MINLYTCFMSKAISYRFPIYLLKEIEDVKSIQFICLLLPYIFGAIAAPSYPYISQCVLFIISLVDC